MRRFVLGLFAAIGIIASLTMLGAGALTWYLFASRPPLPDSIVLTADLNRGLAAGPSQDALSEIVFGDKPTLRGFLDAIERAGDDPRVKALYVQLGQDGLALATAQEVRDAIQAFRAKGKFALAFSESFGEFGPGTRPYYLATAFDEIWVQPLGSVGLIGLRAEIPFLRGTLDWLGIKPSFGRREEYKTATNSLTETAMTGPQREETEALLNSVSGQIVRGIAAARRLAETQVGELIDRGPLFADEAKEAGLIDRIGYRDEALAAARGRAGSGARLMPLSRYRRSRRPAACERPEDRADLRHRSDRAGERRRRPDLRQRDDERTQGRARLPRGGRAIPTCARSCSASTAPAARRSLPRRSGARSPGRASAASRSSYRWATWPVPAAITSPLRPTRSSRSPRH